MTGKLLDLAPGLTVRWVEQLPDQVSADPVRWDTVVGYLQSRPGTWLEITTINHNASAIAHRLRRRFPPIDTAVRNHVLYLRWPRNEGTS